MEQADGFYEEEIGDKEEALLLAIRNASNRLEQARKDLEKAENALLEFYGYRL